MEMENISIYSSRKHQLINLLFIIVFLSHNIIFFFQGKTVDWHEDSWIKYLKYLILVLFILYNIRGVSFARFLIYIFFNIFFFSQQLSISLATGTQIDYSIFYNFYAALALILISPRVFDKKFLLSGVMIVACFSIFFTFFEYFFLQDVIARNFMSQYDFYRCGSCFLNSNAAGACFVFFSLLFVHKIAQKEYSFLYYFLLISAGVAIALTKSRSGFALYILCFCYALCRIKNKLLLLLSITGCFAFIVFLLSDTAFLQQFNRIDGEESSALRFSQIQITLSALMDDLFLPINRYPTRLDVGILQFIFDFGLLGFVLYFSIIIKAMYNCIGHIDVAFTFVIILLLFFFITAHNIFPFAYFITFLASSFLDKSFLDHNELFHKDPQYV